MSGMPIFMFLSPDAIFAMCIILLVMLYLYIGWILPIMKIRDPSVKTKTGWVMTLIIFGILPIVIAVGLHVQEARRAAGNVSGTSMNAMGPQPVVPLGAVSQMNNMRGALPVNRPPAAY